jgi:hydrogenase maturation protease
MNILVLGIGQSMRGDDAAGLETVRQWQSRFPLTASRVKVKLSEMPGIALIDLLAGMDAAILVDAVRSSSPAGTVIRLGPKELSSFTPDTASSHGWGVAETLHLGFSIYPWLAKCELTLFGIVGSDYDFGSGLTPEIKTAVVKVVELLEDEIQSQISL